MGLKHAISGLRVIWCSRVRTLRRILFHTMMLISKTPARHMIVRMVPYEPISVRSPLVYVGVRRMVALMVSMSSRDIFPFALYTMGLKHAISGLHV